MPRAASVNSTQSQAARLQAADEVPPPPIDIPLTDEEHGIYVELCESRGVETLVASDLRVAAECARAMVFARRAQTDLAALDDVVIIGAHGGLAQHPLVGIVRSAKAIVNEHLRVLGLTGNQRGLNSKEAKRGAHASAKSRQVLARAAAETDDLV